MPKEHQLFQENSNFLKQHADNPVNWYPWGNEAFAKAEQENKPIFLSVGYSTNHLCHVIERESFRDQQVADYLNEHYVSILVDQEERPDIASLYAKVCRMMTGQSGFPLSIFMTPKQIPYYAGTYFPREGKSFIPGIMDVLMSMHHEFHDDPEHITAVTKSVSEELKNSLSTKSPKKLSSKYTIKAYQLLHERQDTTYGGFGAAPKFPAPQNILFLLRFYRLTGKKDALKTAEHTLKAMANGGIYDHIGFGFSHYAIDEKWLVPHFEKKLSDNALLLIAFTECYQMTKKPFYKEVSEQIISFVMRELHRSNGAFHSAIDSESGGVEGGYYVWELDDVQQILDEELEELYTKAYGMTPEGNFKGKNIPNLVDSDLGAIAEEHQLTLEELYQQLEAARVPLLAAREAEREHPTVDKKILTASNAMMITALAKAGNVFEEPNYLKTAEDTMAFIETNLVQNERVMACYYDNDTLKCNGYLHDYAYLLEAYIELYHTTLALPYLNKARELADRMIGLFWDRDQAGFFASGYDSEKLFIQDKEIFDHRLPSGNSVAALALIQLGHLTGETAYFDKVDDMYHTFYMDVRQNPATTTSFMQSLLLTELPTKEVIMIGNDRDFTTQLQQEFLPNVSLLQCETPEQLTAISPFASNFTKLDGETTFYVCENFVCNHPTTDPAAAWKLVKKN
ncbi:thioredoxin domain-containing protein [Lentibacillus sp. Marseille-P4043]|uniref:thioredoxin domain-containing protein n=1 Tax=Lentibacillus sp. Marseille-P4043 TaxID=2040293 RepID=UPI000D0BD9EA|nr:thioredoxin domain-containing protein [Lentibacillus sp. Marseille-P4043]